MYIYRYLSDRSLYTRIQDNKMTKAMLQDDFESGTGITQIEDLIHDLKLL